MNNLYVEVGSFRTFGTDSLHAGESVTVLARDNYTDTFFQFGTMDEFLSQFPTASSLVGHVIDHTEGFEGLSYSLDDDGVLELENCGLQVVGFNEVAQGNP